MPTVFTRQSLLDAAKSAVANMEAELADYDRRVKEYKEKHKLRWIAQNRDDLRRARDRITKALRKGGVIERDQIGDVNRMFYQEPSSIAIGNDIGYLRNDYRKNFERRIDAYRGVVRMLEATEGDTLSISQMKSLGLTKTGELFRIAANNGGVLDDKNPLI